ncbi:PREDICTED: uncharacterized protein LOC101313201 [Fragaria vesca subsp. vesca]|uniref:uncharacterized protein LOC101313201 n=1 Tax=Fragaria vesca subsp. vesca TaxID=101020 RepID=UPI0002C2FA65|nr:PREDICTED: uncharacterized protein LOC101313201 [Fragaria vesca subsp. vesca]
MSSTSQSQSERRLSVVYYWASQWDPVSGITLPNFDRSRALLKYMFFKVTRPFRRWIDPRRAHMIPIHLKLIKQSQTRSSIRSPVDIAEPKLFGERRFMVPISEAIAEWDLYKEVIAGYLSTMIAVSADTEKFIMQMIYEAIEKAEPGWPIDVVVMSVTVDILGVVVPTTELFHRLDNVRLDSLESSTRQKPCRICRKSLDHFHELGEGITRLPCSHIFHVGCFVQSLELSPVQTCPTCDHQLHITGAPRASWPWDWPLFLMVSAGSMLTGALVGRLLRKK